jgi:hypothetical protein
MTQWSANRKKTATIIAVAVIVTLSHLRPRRRPLRRMHVDPDRRINMYSSLTVIAMCCGARRPLRRETTMCKTARCYDCIYAYNTTNESIQSVQLCLEKKGKGV